MEFVLMWVTNATLGTKPQLPAHHATQDGLLAKELVFWVEVNNQLSLPLSLQLNPQLNPLQSPQLRWTVTTDKWRLTEHVSMLATFARPGMTALEPAPPVTEATPWMPEFAESDFTTHLNFKYLQL